MDLKEKKVKICFSFSVILEKLKIYWKILPFENIPLFITFIICIDVIFYYSANDTLKRNLVYNSKFKQEFWRFLTYVLVHKDAIHLYLNVAIQGLLGCPIEEEQGPLRCAAIYIFGGLAGAFGTFTFSPPVILAGSSGAIYALLTSHFAHITLNYDIVKHVKYRITAVTMLMIFDVAHVVYHIWLNNNENPRIEWVAHVFGALIGLGVGFVIFRGIIERQKKIRISFFLLLLIIALGCCFYCVYSEENFIESQHSKLNEPNG